MAHVVPPGQSVPAGMTKEEMEEQAIRAAKKFRAMIPTLTAFARILTRRPDVRIICDGSNPRTDGKIIYMRPPFGLGMTAKHVKHLCDKREPETSILLCPACNAHEQVMVATYHEIAHIAHGSFDKSTEVAVQKAIDAAVREVIQQGGTTEYAEWVRGRLNKAPARVKDDSIGLANLVSPWLGIIVNALEDARVNHASSNARPGTRIMHKALNYYAFSHEQRDDDGTVWTWATRELNTQAILAVFAMAARYNDTVKYFAPEVEKVFHDEDLGYLLMDASTLRTSHATFHLSFKVLDRLRELGFCLIEGEPLPPPPEPESQEEGKQDGQPNESKVDPSGMDGSNGPGEGQDPPGEDDQIPDDGGTGASQDEASESDSEGSSDEGSESDQEGVDQDQEGVGDPRQASEEDGQASEEGDVDAEEDNQVSDPADGEGGNQGSDPHQGEDSDRSEDPDDSESPQAGSGEGSVDEQDTESTDQDRDASGEAGEGSSGDDAVPEAGNSDHSEPSPDSEGSPDNGDAGSGSPESGESGSSAHPEPQDSPDQRETDSHDDDWGDWRDEEVNENDGSSGQSDSSASESEKSSDDEHSPQSPKDQPRDGSDEPVDTGADKGLGGIPADYDDNFGTPDQAKQALTDFFQHTPDDEDDEFDPRGQHATIDPLAAAIDGAVTKGLYFEKSPVFVSGVRVHTPDNHILWPDGTDAANAFTDHHNDFRDDILPASSGVRIDSYIPETVLGPALLKMRRVFEDNRRSGKERNLRSGRIRTSVLGKRGFTDDDRLFTKKRIPKKKDYHVVIGIDVSGSTFGMNIALAKRAALAQAELLHRMGVPFEVWAHSAKTFVGHGIPRPTSIANVGFMLDMYQIKAAIDPWSPAIQRVLATLAADSDNLDGHSLEFYRHQIELSQATDKIIMYYTDGKMPAANFDEELLVLRRELKTCRAKGIVVAGVGIRTDSPIEHGLPTVQVDDDSDLIKVAGHLEKLIHGR